MSHNEYEFIGYPKLKHCKVGFVEILMRNLHVHKEFEFGLILKGTAYLRYNKKHITINSGEMFLFNPNEAHEIRSTGTDSVRIVYLQLSRYFCNDYLHLLRNIEFDSNILSEETIGIEIVTLRKTFLASIVAYISNDPLSLVVCMKELFNFLDLVLHTLQHHTLDESVIWGSQKNNRRIERIMEYIEMNSNEKISLAKLAESEGLTVNYLSDFIHKHTGMTFQTLVTNARTEKAAKLLLQTNMRSIDICLESGFSDTKYLNQAFLKHFNCTPAEFRERRNDIDTTNPKTESGQTYVTDTNGLNWILTSPYYAYDIQ